jgi:hypothetical protein
MLSPDAGIFMLDSQIGACLSRFAWLDYTRSYEDMNKSLRVRLWVASQDFLIVEHFGKSIFL